MKKRFVILAKAYDKRGRMLSSATNSYTKSHPLQAYIAAKVGMPECKFLHAEILALLRAKGKHVHKLTIERFDAKGLPILAAPCPICREAIKMFGVKEVLWT